MHSVLITALPKEWDASEVVSFLEEKVVRLHETTSSLQ